MGLNPGDLVDDKYRIVRRIGEGGMGSVYEGENTRIHRRVAIKVLHANVASMADVVARFEREAQAAGRIGSEHIVEVLDLGTLPGGDRYMVMEFMDGDSLSGRIRQRGRLLPNELYPIAHQLLDALAAAHAAGIIHRDLKPDNVFLLRNRKSQPDFVKLLDFGISKFGSGGSALSMTRTGAVMGTPYYMAPEQAKGSRGVDHRVDLYAVGVILYEALAGQVPFLADTFNELLFKIVLEKPRPLVELVPELDADLVALIEKAMAREPAERFQSAHELQLALDAWARGAGLHASATGAGYPAIAGGVSGRDLGVRTPVDAAPLGATPGIWSGTSAGPVAAPKSRRASLASFVAVAVIAGGAGAFLLLSGAPPGAGASGVASSGVNEGSANTLSVAPSPAKPSAEPAKPSAEPAKPSAEPAKPSAEPAKPVVALAPAASAASEAPTAAAKLAAAARPPTIAKARTVTPQPSPAALKTASPPPPAKTEGTGTTTSGRKIRQTL